MDAAPPARAQQLFGVLLGTLMLGVMGIAFNISFAAIIYQGELAPHVDRGIALTLLGASGMAAVGALVLSYRGTLCQPQDTPAVVLSLAAAGVAARIGDPASEQTFATVAALIALTTALGGAAAWLLGRLRLGFVARFVPFPVLAGFIAATGYLLVMGALGMMLAERVDIWTLPVLLAPGNPARWLPWAVLGIGVALLMRRIASPLVLPLSLLAAGAGFYLLIGVHEMTLIDARAQGLLMGPFGGEGFFAALDGWQPLAIDWLAIAAQAPSILTIVGLACAGALLSASALEVAVHSPIDPDRDLRGVGLANLASAVAGGPLGFHVLSETLLARSMGSTGRLNGLAIAAACLIAVFLGAGAIATLPVGLFGLLVVAIGLGMLLSVLIDERPGLSVTDQAVVLIIPGVTAVFGFLWGVAVGLVAAALFFIVAFARIDVVRFETTGARFRSRVERSDADQARLARLGRQSLVYVLAGYLFFGTAHRLVSRILRAVERTPRPRFAVVDFRRVRGVDTSAARALVRLDALCRDDGVGLWLTGLDAASAQLIRGQAGRAPPPRMTDTLQQALEEVEAILLAEPSEPAPAATPLDAFRSRHPDAELRAYVERVSVPAGAEIISQGAPSDFLLMLRTGLLRTEVIVPDAPPLTVARCLPGALVGEIGLYAGVPRTARVVAEEPSEVLRIDRAALERMARDDPAMLADFHRLIAAILARRLSRTTALLADSEMQAG